MHDLLITGGTVIDGSGAPRFAADVAIDGTRIGAVAGPGALAGSAARRRIDAAGLIVAPGFIDSHTHDDRLLLEPPLAGGHPKLQQGVTTVVTGNCGVSLAPLVHPDPPPPLDIFGAGGPRFTTFAAYLEALRALRPATHVVPLVGHTTLRVGAMADLGRAADEAEIARMRAALGEALAAGAFGLSTGVFYPPARAATAAEVIAVGAPLRGLKGTRGAGLVTMHIRDEADDIDAALREALAIGRALDVDLVLSHHKLMGRANHGRSRQTLALIEQAARTQHVCLDCYPYAASSTMLMPERVPMSTDVQITWARDVPAAAGRRLSELAREAGLAPEVMARRLMPAGAIYFAMDEADVERILAHPLTMIGSDGLPGDPHPHPRLWGSFPRVLAHYARERRLFSLETAVHKMTGLPARRFGLADRGRVAVGAAADLTLFDPARIEDTASYDAAIAPPRGIAAVIVGGRVAVEAGDVVELHAGEVLRPGWG